MDKMSADFEKDDERMSLLTSAATIECSVRRVVDSDFFDGAVGEAAQFQGMPFVRQTQSNGARCLEVWIAGGFGLKLIDELRDDFPLNLKHGAQRTFENFESVNKIPIVRIDDDAAGVGNKSLVAGAMAVRTGFGSGQFEF